MLKRFNYYCTKRRMSMHWYVWGVCSAFVRQMISWWICHSQETAKHFIWTELDSAGPRAPHATSCCCLCGWCPYNGPPHRVRWDVSISDFWRFIPKALLHWWILTNPLFAPGATVNAKDHVWLTPLHRAAASRNEVSSQQCFVFKSVLLSLQLVASAYIALRLHML